MCVTDMHKYMAYWPLVTLKRVFYNLYLKNSIIFQYIPFNVDDVNPPGYSEATTKENQYKS